MAFPSLYLTRAPSTTPLPPQCLSWRCLVPPAVYAALNSLYHVDGGHRAIGFNRIDGIKDKIYEAAVQCLMAMQGPLPVKFLLPYPSDRFSLRPGRLSLKPSSSGTVVRSERFNTAIEGARAAATQFSRTNQGITSTAYIVSEESPAVGPSRGGSGAATVSEHAETRLSLRNNKSVNTTKVEVSASTEGSQAVATHSYRNTCLMGPTGGVGTNGSRKRGSNTPLGGTNKDVHMLNRCGVEWIISYKVRTR